MVNRRLIAACSGGSFGPGCFVPVRGGRPARVVGDQPGTADVAWGSVPKYQEYVAQLNWFLPAGLVPVVGWAATRPAR